MAVATYTSSVFANLQPKAPHIGNVTVSGQYSNLSATTLVTVGDTILLAKIPHGAKIIDMQVDHTTNETALGIQYGLASGAVAGGGASYSCFSATLAKGTISRITVQRPFGSGLQAVSVSDNDPNRWAAFSATILSGTASTSFAINFQITYTMDGAQG
jgi:hypothetical protein